MEVKKAEDRASLSRLELLPLELREYIYFYLGLPVCGTCIHTCDISCWAYRLLANGIEEHNERRATEEGILDGCLHRGILSQSEYDNLKAQLQPPFNLLEMWARFKAQSHHVKLFRSASSGKLVGIGEHDMKHHAFFAPGRDLMATNRFFYNDIRPGFQNIAVDLEDLYGIDRPHD